MSFTNLYYKRTTGTPRACYVCYKPTTTVLATAQTVDFLYTCDAHLNDAGFATRVEEPKSDVTAEAIAKVKEEWEASQKRKEKARADKEKASAKASPDKDETEDGEGKADKKTETKSPSPPGSMPGALSPASPSTPSTPAHEKYALHRHMFAMRQDDHRKRRQVKQMQELAPRLPGAPRGTLD
ncbi:VPS4-associated protein 1 [Amylostereum chailletii]|nr:VPS4-associated protein 1 [Amylostereum chailletii]